RIAAWVALALIAAHQLTVLALDLREAPLDLQFATYPENAWLLVVLVPFILLNMAVSLGVWLPLEARRGGGGRWAWRCLLGGLLVVLLAAQTWTLATSPPP